MGLKPDSYIQVEVLATFFVFIFLIIAEARLLPLV